MKDIIEDLFKIYMACVDGYNSKFHQVVNDKYTVIDKSMITVYLFLMIMEDRDENNSEITDTLVNYLLKPVIFSETGNLAIEITDSSKAEMYYKILNKLILEKFEYKNRIIKYLKYMYKDNTFNQYNELLDFLENIAEICMLKKLSARGNTEVYPYIEQRKNELNNILKDLNENDNFYDEKTNLVKLIITNEFENSQYGNLVNIALNLKDIYRYSSITITTPENVLFHQYVTTVMLLNLVEYSNNVLKEEFDIYTALKKSLMHDFSEYKGNEIVTQFKNYNDITKKMFAEIEEADERDLEKKIGSKLYYIILNEKKGPEGYIMEIADKILGIMRLWVDAGYLGNNNVVRATNSVYQDRFKRFLRIENIEQIKNKEFYINLLREYYIYIKEHLIENNIEYTLKYFTKEEVEEFRKEIKLLRTNPEIFLK